MVLILVVVDNGLVPVAAAAKSDKGCVLILVVVDNGLVQHAFQPLTILLVGLNPCCSGQWSRTLG